MTYTFTRTGPEIEAIHNTVDDLPNRISNENLITNSDFSIAGNVTNAPDATPRSYSADDELFAGFKALGALSGVTYVNGKLNGTGQIYVDVYKSEKEKLSTVTHVASIASSDGVPVESGASFVDSGDYWRVTFDMSDTFSVKLEQGSVATKHDSEVGVVALNATNQLFPEQRAFYTGKSVWDYADKVTFKPDVNDPSTWNWTPAVDAMQAVHSVIYFPSYTKDGSQSKYRIEHDYEFIDKIPCADGYTDVILECFDPENVVDAAFIFSGRTSPQNIQVGYPESSLTGTEGDGDKIAVLTGKTVANQRVAWGNFKVKFCGTGVASKQSKEDLGLKNTCFSVTFPFVEIENFTHKAWDFDTTTRTGNVYLNIFCQTEPSKKGIAPYDNQVGSFYCRGQENNCTFGMINSERVVVSENEFHIDSISGIGGGAFHSEDSELTSNYKGVLLMQNTGALLPSISVINRDITTEGFSIIELGDARYSDSEATSTDVNTMILDVQQLNLKRLNRTTGLTGVVNPRLVYRPSGKSGTYKVRLGGLRYLTNAAPNDASLYVNMMSGLNSPTILEVNWQDGVSRVAVGTENFSGESLKTVTFNVPMPDTNYKISQPSTNVPGKSLVWSNKTLFGFDIEVYDSTGSVDTLTAPVDWEVKR